MLRQEGKSLSYMTTAASANIPVTIHIDFRKHCITFMRHRNVIWDRYYTVYFLQKKYHSSLEKNERSIQPNIQIAG